MSIADDQEILGGFAQAETKTRAMNQLIQNYQKGLYWHIRKIVISHDAADDVLQNTFITVWRGLETFKSESTLSTWIYGIGTNEALIFLREKSKRHTSAQQPIEFELAQTLENDPYFSGDAIQLKLQKAILSLPEKQRLVFNMRYFDETPYEVMSAILASSERDLKDSYQIAAKAVEELLKS
ncbi:MAG: RNA polymerase sigma factor [Sphingobacteriia bacterium]|jgi:RNA polymerase sigma-70 factor (ECF subfamily)|nr:RNA polymerase sigma factor [Sphingobacteriia bacterium]